MRRVRKIIYRAVQFLLGIVLLVSAYLLIVQRLSGDQAPEIFGFRQAAAVSGSMEPIFSPGDFIIYRERADYQVGDIVLFRQEGSLITHRIIGEQEGKFQTQGDANNAADEELVPQDAILGQLVLVLPKVGNAVLFLRTPFGMLLLLVSTVGALWVPHIRKE